ncbi:MAG: glycine--tRNA ligase subunit beta [Syntrophomonadaceae bacterium]|nr:glycine--tRNA ligase subunit beta [Syntrophomonadaceae bacterium]
MARDLVFEIGTEEMPAAYMPGAIRELERLARDKFAETGLAYQSLRTTGTPRRLVLYVEGLAETQPDSIKEARGPKRDQAFDDNGQPTRAALGFARAQGVEVDQLELREVSGVTYVFAVKKEIGKNTMEVLPGLLENLVRSMGFPKSMRWGYSELRFARPIRWMLALFGRETVPVQVENIRADNQTFGHRFLAEGPFKIGDASEYFRRMEELFVIVDHVQRQALIREQVTRVAAQNGGRPLEDEELLEEVNFLLEYPTAFYGEFSPEYLTIPPEVLTTSMREHQRYFPVFSPENQLLPGFVGVRNGDDYNLQTVKEGNERVLRARLEDALFFYREDTKEPLELRVELLKNVVYQARLGTVYAKTARLQEISTYIGRELGLGQTEKIRRAAYLCKADLETNMVYEFPELQGIMGRYYARSSGEEPEVAEAIFEHYLPRFAGDDLPSTPAGIAVSLAEKLDNLVGCFSIGIKPTGSQDPYALRRQALGIVNILLHRNLPLDLKKVIERVYQGFVPISPDFSSEETTSEVLDFILQRMRGLLLERGISYDVLDAVLAVPEGNLLRVNNRVQVLSEFKANERFEDLMIVFNRCYNLARKWHQTAVDESGFEVDQERRLFARLTSGTPTWRAKLEAGDFQSYLVELAGLRPEVDALFDAVMIMAEDRRVRANRLGMLRWISNLFLDFADFSRLV